MKEILNALENFADDAAIEIRRIDSDSLLLRVELPSRDNEQWDLMVEKVVHLDMNTDFILGHTTFGNSTLLPEGYIESRNFDHGLAMDDYKIIKFTDVDSKQHFITYLGNLTLMRVKI